jgi:hypothetical protein
MRRCCVGILHVDRVRPLDVATTRNIRLAMEAEDLHGLMMMEFLPGRTSDEPGFPCPHVHVYPDSPPTARLVLHKARPS